MAKSKKKQQPQPNNVQQEKSLRVTFIHPDLGIGGAENLIVNAMVSLQKKGHHVEMYTSQHDPAHCFEETKGDGPLAAHIHVHGNWIPPHVFGRFHALCAVLRMMYVALVVAFFENSDVIVCDQVSSHIPLLRLFCSAPVFFYCHFPDKMLCTDRRSILKRLYRWPLDWLEEKTTGGAQRIVVNSKFTAGIFAAAFPSITVAPSVLYPPINTANFELTPEEATAPSRVQELLQQWQQTGASEASLSHNSLKSKSKRRSSKNNTQQQQQQKGVVSGGGGGGEAPVVVLASINRFERKKNVGLAIRALACLRERMPASAFQSVHLILAGGYDPRVAENVEHLQELRDETAALGLSDRVHFLPSFSNKERIDLLECSRAVIYTPDKEHFGIVPVEAMYARVPVVAVASGGPLESVLNGETGYLCPDTPDAFAGPMLRLVEGGVEGAAAMGLKGRKHVVRNFTLEAFGARLDGLVRDLYQEQQRSRGSSGYDGKNEKKLQ